MMALIDRPAPSLPNSIQYLWCCRLQASIIAYQLLWTRSKSFSCCCPFFTDRSTGSHFNAKYRTSASLLSKIVHPLHSSSASPKKKSTFRVQSSSCTFFYFCFHPTTLPLMPPLRPLIRSPFPNSNTMHVTQCFSCALLGT